MKTQSPDPRFTPEFFQTICKGYDTRVIFYDYFTKLTVYDGPIDKGFFAAFSRAMEEAVEPFEVWKTTYSGKDYTELEHMEQNLYKGAYSKYMEPHQLHMTVRIYFRKRSDEALGKRSWFNKFLYALGGIFLLDTIFPPKEGSGTFLRDSAEAWAILKIIDKLDERKKEE